MKVLFFDTETNGLPKDWKAAMVNVDNWPRVIQLAWELTDTDKPGDSRERCDLVLPDGWLIPAEKFWLDNGFHQKDSIKKGVGINTLLQYFLEAVQQADLMVAHNMNFDYNVLGAEMIRAGVRAGKSVAKFCTMQSTISLCKIPFVNSKYPKKDKWKFPQLAELYRHLFGKEMEGAHDAMQDVHACRDCFLELMNKKLISV